MIEVIYLDLTQIMAVMTITTPTIRTMIMTTPPEMPAIIAVLALVLESIQRGRCVLSLIVNVILLFITDFLAVAIRLVLLLYDIKQRNISRITTK